MNAAAPGSGAGKRPLLERLRAIWKVRAQYKAAHGRAPQLLRPRRFTEKMQWRKLFDQNPMLTNFCDKLTTRAFVVAKIGDTYLPELLWSGDNAEIPFDALSPPYVIKSAHASGHIIKVEVDDCVDRAQVRALAAEWLQLSFAGINLEPGYRNVPRRLMVERMLKTDDGHPPLERRLFVFGGKVEVINTVFLEAGRLRNGAFHTPDWQWLDWYFSRKVSVPFPPPAKLAEMIQIAECLGEGIDHIRVDCYDCGARIYVGELTPYSWSGLSPFQPDKADFILGEKWHLPQPMRRAVNSLLHFR
jgi:hypothetical protein